MHSFPVLAAILALTTTAATAHDTAPAPRTISVSGSGEASGKPDRAHLVLAVEKQDADLKKAEGDVNRVVRAYLAEAKALGAKDEQVTTTGVTVQPEYVWPEPGRERRLSGYRAVRQIELKLEALDKLGDFILRATQVGVNQVNPPQLESSKAKELERQALAKAADDARAKARVLADTLGVKLGGAYRVVESAVGITPPMPYQMRAMRAEGAVTGNVEMGITPGELRFNASVTVEFELLAP